MATAAADPDNTPPDALTSFELITRATHGDQLAKETLFERYRPRLLRWAHGRLPAAVRRAYETHDLVQDTLLNVLSHLGTFVPRHEGAFQAYVRTVLNNRILDLARQGVRQGFPAPLDDDLPGSGLSPLEAAIGTERRERYERALNQLRPEDRELIIARVEMGLPFKEVAEMCGKPSVSAATMAVRRAIVRLVGILARD